MYSRMIDLHPKVTFINLSSKDITTDVKPRDIFNWVVCIIDDLQAAVTTTVFIAEIITRGDFSKSPDPNLDKPSFDKIDKKINILLANATKTILFTFPTSNTPKATPQTVSTFQLILSQQTTLENFLLEKTPWEIAAGMHRAKALAYFPETAILQ